MSQYQRDILPFVRYAPDAAANYIGCQIGGEISELKQVFSKPLYRGGEPDMNEVIDELGDVRWFLAALCTHIGLDLDRVKVGYIATPPMNLYARLTRMAARGEHIGNRLIEHWRREWFEPEIGYLLFDLEEIRKLTGKSWAEIEALNIDKLTARQAQRAAAL